MTRTLLVLATAFLLGSVSSVVNRVLVVHAALECGDEGCCDGDCGNQRCCMPQPNEAPCGHGDFCQWYCNPIGCPA